VVAIEKGAVEKGVVKVGVAVLATARERARKRGCDREGRG